MGASRVDVRRVVLWINRSFVQVSLIVRFQAWQFSRGLAPSTRKPCQLRFHLHGDVDQAE